MPAGFSAQDFTHLAPEIVLAASAMVVLVADVFVPRGRQAVLTWLAGAGIVATGAALVPFAGTDITVARGLVAIDGFALFFKAVFLLAALLVIVMSARYMEVEGAKTGSYHFLVLAATLGMMFMASGMDLITIFIGLETMAVSFYVLAGFLKPNRRSNEAAVKYFLLGTFSLGLLLYGMSLLYGLSGSTNLSVMSGVLAGRSEDPRLVLAVILVVAGIGFKIAAVPFHMWAPDVYEGAPTPITAFLSVGSKAASFAMLLRIFFEGLPSAYADWRVLFYTLSLVTMTAGNIAALTQSNIKRLLAYSSIAHAGYVLIGVTTGTARGVAATLIYLGIYAFMQLGAFAVVTMLRRRDVIGDELKDLAGLYLRSPFAAVAMLLFMLSLGGIPPTAGFMGKFWLFGAAIETGQAAMVWLAVIGVLNSAVSLYYYVRVVVFMWIKQEQMGSPVVLTPGMAAVLGVAVSGTVVLGIYPWPLFDLATYSAHSIGALGGVALLP
ncbi:MAG: NADH-quinone oxidoreductase subunit N [Vicinamibacterales bacterium]